MRKFISIIICFALFVPFFNMASFASGVSGTVEFEVQALQFPEDEAVFVHNPDQLISFYSNPSNPYLFRDLLTPAQKNVYDAIVEQQAGLSKEGAVTFTVPASENLKKTLQAAVSAVIADCPEFFWVGGYKCAYYTPVVQNYDITLTFALDTNIYTDWNILKKDYYYPLLSVVENFKVKGTTRYEKLKSIHDQICKMTIYYKPKDQTQTQLPSIVYHPTGVFLKGEAVCEGYAEALKLLCDREGIPCLIVVGTGKGGAHEWNYVQMEDGKWYGVDATWDDQGSEIFYDYFLVGAESMINKRFGENRKFGNGTDPNGDHITSGTHFTDALYALTYPAISTQSYTGVIPMWNSAATFDNTRNFMFIPKNVVAREQILCTSTWDSSYAPSTNSATVSDITTGGTVDITSPVSRTYTIVRHGDVDENNKVDAADYKDLRSVAMHQQEGYKNAAQFAAADMNDDGIIDAVDVIHLDLYYKGLVD